MLLAALTNQKKIISANNAKKHTNYSCPSCQQIVRLRGGIYKRKHFYHLHPTNQCHARAKSITHTQIQLKLNDALNNSQMEHFFPQIKRIADVVWWPQHIIFEIQCSPITTSEIIARNKDYQSIGFEVVWVLHDKRFNKKHCSPAEQYLQHMPRYFTNINSNGQGIIYDQIEQQIRGYRVYQSKPFCIDPTSPLKHHNNKNTPQPIYKRLQESPLYFTGDVVDAILSQKIPLSIFNKQHRTKKYRLLNPIIWYRTLLFLLLKSVCK